MCLEFLTLIIFSVVFHSANAVSSKFEKCFKDRTQVPPGNLGQTPFFPWLGLLRIHHHKESVVEMAVSGVVLVKEKIAIGVANDIEKVPKATIKAHGNVMFIVEKNELWFCKIKDYRTYSYNSIGLLELYPDKEDDPFKAIPICWPEPNFDTKNELYLIQYVDDNKVLEKNFIKLQFVDKPTCDEFYLRSSITNENVPSNYLCAFFLGERKYCVWENGNIMASNASGNWVLIGIGTRGPGCVAPNRFINTLEYKQWIDEATLDENEEEPTDGEVYEEKRFVLEED